MGYMGFGMQKWVYKMKPRRPFSKDRKPNLNEIKTTETKFILKKDESIFSQRIKAISTLVIFAMVIFAFAYFAVQMLNKSKTSAESIEKSRQNEKNDAFMVLFENGKRYLSNGNRDKAKSELELALNLKPENYSANIYFIYTLKSFCLAENKYCDKIIIHINKILKKYPDRAEIIELKNEFLNDDNLSE